MAVIQRIINYDNLFETTSNEVEEMVIVNDVDSRFATDRQMLMDQLITQYEGDTLSVVPTCRCGETKGAFRLGKECQECFTVVSNPSAKLWSTAWLRVPDGVHGFIHPRMYRMLSKRYQRDKINILDYLLGKNFKNMKKDSSAIDYLKKVGLKRGINNFIEQFDLFLEVGFHGRICTSSKKERAALREWVITNREALFPKYLPLPNKAVFVAEESFTHKHSQLDKDAEKCVDMAWTMADLVKAEAYTDEATMLRKKQTTVLSIVKQASDFYSNFIKDKLGQKHGWFRKNIYGTLAHFTFRGVIKSIHGKHCYQDIYLPWSIGVNIFELHITSYLIKDYGWSPEQCKRLIRDHTYKYSELLDGLMKRIISEHPSGKFPVIFHRNPTLLRGSAQQLYISKVESDPNIRSISMSLLCLASCNADFDGDELNGMLIVDLKMYEELKMLAPKYGVLDLQKPREVSTSIKLPTPVVSNIASWYADRH